MQRSVGAVKDESYQGYRFSGKRWRMRKRDIMDLLKDTYWAKGRPWEQVKKALRHSLPFGIFDARGNQVGLARVLTDFSTTFYLADVVVKEDLRGSGLGKAFMAYILKDPRFCNTKGMLLTRTAHGFYEHFDFAVEPERCMLREYDKRKPGA